MTSLDKQLNQWGHMTNSWINEITWQTAEPMRSLDKQLNQWGHMTNSWTNEVTSQTAEPMRPLDKQLNQWGHLTNSWTNEVTWQTAEPMRSHDKQLNQWGHMTNSWTNDVTWQTTKPMRPLDKQLNQSGHLTNITVMILVLLNVTRCLYVSESKIPHYNFCGWREWSMVPGVGWKNTTCPSLPPPGGQNDTHLWKYYLTATLFAGRDQSQLCIPPSGFGSVHC